MDLSDTPGIGGIRALRTCLVSGMVALLFCLISSATSGIVDNRASGIEIPSIDLASTPEPLSNFPLLHFVDLSKSLKASAVKQNLLSAKRDESTFVYPSYSANHWFVFTLKNSSDEQLQRFLWLDALYADTIDLYQEVDNRWLGDLNGAGQSLAHRQVPTHLPTFGITLDPGEEITFYLKCHFSSFVLRQSIVIASHDVYQDTTKVNTVQRAIFFWSSFICLLLSILHWLRKHQTSALCLVGFFSTQLMWLLAHSGYYLNILPTLLPPTFFLAGLPLSIAFLIQFCRILLQTKQTPRIDRLLIVQIIFFGIFTLIPLVNFLMYGYVRLLSIFMLCASLGIGVGLVQAKQPNAKRFLIALFIFSVGYSADTAFNASGISVLPNVDYLFILCTLISSGLFLTFSLLETSLTERTSLTQQYDSSDRIKFHAFERYTSSAIDLDSFSSTSENDKNTLMVMNQEKFNLDLNRVWLSHAASTSPISVLSINIDHFALFNDTFGRKKGDEAIRSLIEILHHVRRDENDLLGQLKGDVLGLLLPNTSVAVAKTLADTTVKQFWNQHYGHVNVSGRLTLSIGIASMIPDASEAWGLVELSLRALNIQKHQGGNGTTIYSPHTDQTRGQTP